jgi:4-hydroxybenzoate polyprenyltransferase
VTAEVPVEVARAPAQRLRPLLAMLRPRQYTKNLLTLAGIVFAGEAARLHVWPRAALVLLLYCLASSAGYIYNDLRDLSQDRLHPVKRRRPLASGSISTATARTSAALLGVLALAGASVLGATSMAYLLVFLALQAAYSWWLKHVPFLDIALIAALFELRAVAGAEAIRVPISGWLLACTPLLAAFLALGKRRAEVRLVHDGSAPGRGVLRWYSPRFLDRALVVAASCAVAAYAAYAAAGPSTRLLATVPLVVVGLARYLLLLYRRGEGEEPESTLLSDPLLLATVGTWAVACAALLVSG